MNAEDFKKYAPKHMVKPQMFASYPISWMDDGVKTSSEAMEIMGEVARLLQKLTETFTVDVRTGKLSPTNNLKDFYEFVNKDDLNSITMYLSECFYDMDRYMTLIKKVDNIKKLSDKI